MLKKSDLHLFQYFECNFLNLRFEYRGLIIAVPIWIQE